MPPEPASPRLWSEGRAVLEWRQLLSDPVLRGVGVPDGEGQPVLAVPGLLSPDSTMRTMTGWLRRTGHHATSSQAGMSLACGEETTQRLERRLEGLVHQRGQRAAVVGHSRGGQFARVLGVRRPDLVSGVVTLGSPRLAEPRAAHPGVRVTARALAMMGSLGMPHLMRWSCFSGACCARFRQELAAELPTEVTHISIVPTRDAIVRSEFTRGFSPDSVEVDASHLGVVVNAGAYRALAATLARIREADRLR